MAIPIAAFALLCATPAVSVASHVAPARPAPVEPAYGATITAGTQVTFIAHGPPGEFLISARVSRSSQVSPDGLIGYDATIFSLTEGAPGVYSYTAPAYTFEGYYLATAGTYFWQPYRIECHNDPDCYLEGPISTFTVAGSPSSPGTPGYPSSPRTDRIPWEVGYPSSRSYYVNDYVGPSYINAPRFVQLVRSTASRWGLGYAGTTYIEPGRDGVNVVGFSYAVPEGALGVEIEYLRRGYRRGKRRCRIHRHRSGKRHRHCRRGKRRQVTVPTGERDVAINATIPWDQGPGRPAADLWDLQTTLIHELGHFAGNSRHVYGCVNSPLIDALTDGEWWHGTNDWMRYGCTNSAFRRRQPREAEHRHLLHVKVPPGATGLGPELHEQSHQHP